MSSIISNFVNKVQEEWEQDGCKYDLQLKDTDKLITSYLSFRGLQRQHIDSFNYFLQHKLKQIVLESIHNRRVTTDANPSFLLEYTNIYVDVPTHEFNQDAFSKKTLLYPYECRTSDLTYAGDIYVDCVIYMGGKNPDVMKNIRIGRMPIMLGSSKCNLVGRTENELFSVNECPYDPKGYFIVKGVEKVLLIQEQMVDNRIIVDYNSKTDSLETVVTSYNIETKSKASIIQKRMKLYVKSSSFKDVPLFILFKALGVESEQEIVQMIGGEDYMCEELTLSLEDIETENIYTQDEALEYLGKCLKTYSNQPRSKKSHAEQAREKLATVFLAHVNCKKYDLYPRALYLGLMVRRLIQAMKDKTMIDNRDYYGNKRMKCAGQLIELLFEDKFKSFNSALSKYLDKELGKGRLLKAALTARDIVMYMNQNRDIITSGMYDAISTGNWKIKRFNMDRKGVSQLLARISFISAIGMMTKMSSQFEKTRKISGPRALLGSHWGMICPSDTPDGESCGLVKQLALLTHITNDHDQEGVLQMMIALGVEDIGHYSPHEFYLQGTYLVFLNGSMVGLHRQPNKFISDIKILRRSGRINEFVSVYEDTKRQTLNVSSDSGRLVRPLIIVQNEEPMLKQEHISNLKNNNAETEFSNFVRKGLMEYLDVNEQDNALIALTPRHLNQQSTHLEIDQMTILSCVTSIIPFPHHNQSPRNTYQCQMGKQSLGVIGNNQLTRCDTVLYLLIYPQTPLVRTIAMESINYHKLPAGHNAQVAVMSYSCYDIEDALIVNKSSLDRGFGRTAIYRRYETECTVHTRNGEYVDKIVAPVQDTNNKNHKKQLSKRYHALDQDGLSRIGAKLNNGDVYVNKITPKVPSNAYKSLKQQVQDQKPVLQDWAETPAVLKSHWGYTVDRVILTRNEKDVKTVKTIMRQMRRPELGDKFSSRHGQKGVLGLIVNQEDMPFNESGWCPDLIMNPHGYPSRMTVGKLIELMCGKLGALEGTFKYGTAFGGEKVDQISEALARRGFHFQGKDCLISGITGEYMQCYVFQGPIFYQRLKHMVADKIHARGRGPHQTLTRQPVEGRARDGGQRVGEMERDCLLAYGTSNLLLERLLISSDPFHVWVCSSCGLFKSESNCEGCNTNDVHRVRLPYACKLLFQELLAMNIKPRINLVPQNERQEYTIK